MDFVRFVVGGLLLLTLTLSGCGNIVVGPAGQQTGSSVNPETGSRGGER